MRGIRSALIAVAVLMAAALWCGQAAAQGAVQSMGPVTYGHGVMWVDPGHIMDAGGPTVNGQPPLNNANPGALPLGYAWVNSGLGTCGFSAYSSTTYSRLCLGFDGNGGGLITFDGSGLNFDINGKTYPFPGPGGGTVVGPTVSTLGAVALFADTTGQLLSSAPLNQFVQQTYQNQGYPTNGASYFLRSDINNQIGASNITLANGDQSLLTKVTVTNAALSDTIRITFHNPQTGSPTFVENYTLTEADNQAAVLGLCTTALADPSWIASLAGFKPTNPYTQPIGYYPVQGTCASQTSGGVWHFDEPWSSAAGWARATVVCVSPCSGGTTIAVTGALTNTTQTDGGPQLQVGKLIPEYQADRGALGPWLPFIGQASLSSTGFDAQLGAIFTQWNDTNPANVSLILEGGSGLTSLNIGGSTIAGSAPIESLGASAALSMQDRSGSTIWNWFVSGGVAQLNNGTSSILTVDSSGNTALGSLQVNGVLRIPLVTWTDTQPCAAGQISADASYIYVCTATNTVKRAAISSF